MGSSAQASQKKKQIAIYSDDSSVRADVITALGTRVGQDLTAHEVP